jgi:hypothetical protein
MKSAFRLQDRFDRTIKKDAMAVDDQLSDRGVHPIALATPSR